MGFLSRILALGKAKSADEGAYRLGPYFLEGGWLSATAGKFWNFWQMGYSLGPYGAPTAMVEACLSSYSQTVAMCPGDHWRATAKGGRVRVTDSPLARILRRPNDYQSISDFMLNATRTLYGVGETFALAIRDARFNIAELHLMRHGYPRVAEDGSVFYSLGGNEVVERRGFDLGAVPARDVLHIRLHTPRNPLKGETPLMAAALDVAASSTILQQQIAFFTNQARPSFVLTTDERLTADQAVQLREAWNKQTQGTNAGGTAILTAGLKPQTIATSAIDAQLAETLKMSEENIALAYRVPLQIFGRGNMAYASTELLMQSWIASGLGFCLNHIEEAFGLLFGLKGVPDEYLEFDTRALLRSAFKDRIEGLARAAISGIYSPDETRAELELPAVEGGYGKLPRVQQQVVPLDWHDKNPAPLPLPPPTDDDAKAVRDALAAKRLERRKYVS